MTELQTIDRSREGGISKTTEKGLVLAVAVVLSLGAAACGSDGFTYVENKDEGLYFKVPDDWIVSESRGVLETPADQLNRTIENFNDPALPRLPEPWRVSIEANTASGPGPSTCP